MMFIVISLLLSVSVSAAAEEKTQLTLEDLQVLNGGTAVIYKDGDAVTFVDGTCTATPVRGEADAEEIVLSVISLLGGDERTAFEPWRVLHDPAGNNYYVFQQVLGDTLVQGGAVKVITDSDGQMLGLTASVVTDLPESEAEAPSLTAEQAEALVLEHERQAGNGEPALVEGKTEKIVLPVTWGLDEDADKIISRYVWSVYTTNLSATVDGTDLPYLAHYVTLSGEYLYSLPTIIPGDRAGTAGYDASYAFEFMEPAEYSGYVDLSDGTEKEINVTLMRDTRTGMYYLGNIEHKIVVADCWEFLYNNGRVVMEYSPDNREWDQTGLLSLYNYCRAYDYYKEIGWLGGDGKSTPIIVLKDFCDQNHNPIDNAAYAGKFYGWESFLSSSINDFSQCLDVCAHEFTHCVTGTVMTYNAYLNDYGAINEAMSDIHGNLCEMMAGATEDTSWAIGETGSRAMRSMSDPNLYQQPGYVWDVYYRTEVKEPTTANDHGGVHTNSSLLNNTAYLLCTDGAMTLEEARNFWFAVDCAMVPGSDHPQLAKLLPFVLRITGLDAYAEALEKISEKTRLGQKALPETIGDDKALILLDLPDNAVFNNGKWVLKVTSINVDKLAGKITRLTQDFISGNMEGYPKVIRDLSDLRKPAPTPGPTDEKKPGFLTAVLDAALELASGDLPPEENGTPEADADLQELAQWFRAQRAEILYNDMGNAGADGHSICMMSRPGRTIPLLLYLSLKPGDAEIEQMKYLCLLNGRWFDLSGFIHDITDSDNPLEREEIVSRVMESEVFAEAMRAFSSSSSLSDILNVLALDARGGQIYELPGTGLEAVDLSTGFAFPPAQSGANQNKKTRPKELNE